MLNNQDHSTLVRLRVLTCMLGFAVAIEVLGLGRASQQGILVSYQLQDVFQIHVCHWVGESRDLREYCTQVNVRNLHSLSMACRHCMTIDTSYRQYAIVMLQ